MGGRDGSFFKRVSPSSLVTRPRPRSPAVLSIPWASLPPGTSILLHVTLQRIGACMANRSGPATSRQVPHASCAMIHDMQRAARNVSQRRMMAVSEPQLEMVLLGSVATCLVDWQNQFVRCI